MALLDISLVTQVIHTLLAQNIRYHLETGLVVTPSAASPLTVGASATNVLTTFLYHLNEEPAYKNQMPALGGKVPVRETPLGLTLYYVLNAHHGSDHPAGDALRQQTLLGYAAKTLHDYPILTGATSIAPGSPGLFAEVGLAGEDNRIELIVRPLKPEDSTQFWSHADITRPSLFFEARVVMLKPMQTPAGGPPVLGLGLYVQPGGGPLLTRASCTVSFALPPPYPANSLQHVELVPAQVSLLDGPVGTPTPVHADNNRLLLEASSLSGGALSLRLRSGELTVRLDLDDTSQNTAWRIERTDRRIALSFQRTVVSADDGLTHSLLPGMYGASAIVRKQRSTAAGSSQLDFVSNEIPFAVAPQIDRILVDVAAGTVDVRVVGAYLARPPALQRDLDIQLSVQGDASEDIRRMHPGVANPPLDAGTYDRVLDENGAANTLRLLLTAAQRTRLAPNAPLPLRLVINGVQAPPAWVQVT